ncbi:hypothetical protein L0128_20025 [candidate division KSB1 bacterium]|nr:hypothetical protein [candidate division KSB1 bacterium]
MQETPLEKQGRVNFEPGKISKSGFLGTDPRHIHDIVQADEITLMSLGITREAIAERLQYFMNEGKKGLEAPVEIGNFVSTVQWTRGLIACPFGEPGVQPKIMATVHNKSLNQSIQYSQLNIHLIREHGFFEGVGSQFRMEPAALIRFLNLTLASD